VSGVTGSVGSATIQVYGSELVYSIDVLGDDTDISGKDGGEEGDAITFEINGRVVATATWHSGTNVNLDFHPPDPVVTNTGPVNEGSAVTIDANTSQDWYRSDPSQVRQRSVLSTTMATTPSACV
jgi:hypothetical protein